jgi:signal transduction histidine kinase
MPTAGSLFNLVRLQMRGIGRCAPGNRTSTVARWELSIRRNLRDRRDDRGVSITSTDYANPCIRLRCSREAGPLLVEGNRIALRRLFANLLDNALRFGRPGDGRAR